MITHSGSFIETVASLAVSRCGVAREPQHTGSAGSAGPVRLPGPAPGSVCGVERAPALPYLPAMPGSRPLVGLTLDCEEAGGYSRFPWYALRQNYAAWITDAGGLPAALPHEPELVGAFLDRIDALVVTGGDFDVDPALFGAAERHASVSTKDRRTAFELAAVRGALDRDMPVLGVCGGEQLLNVALGGTLVQHIPDAVPGALAHEQPNPRDEPGHAVEIVPGTRLAEIIGEVRIEVNSAHHQAVDRTGDGVAVNARAPDGVVEGIESVAHRFCIGVQWHPEFALQDADRRLAEAFVRAAGA